VRVGILLALIRSIMSDPNRGLGLGFKKDMITISLSEASRMAIAGANMLHGLRQQQLVQPNDMPRNKTYVANQTSCHVSSVIVHASVSLVCAFYLT
jgi:hypothetical protein